MAAFDRKEKYVLGDFDTDLELAPFGALVRMESILWGRDNVDPITLEIGIRSESRKFPFNGFPLVAFAGKTIIVPDALNRALAIFRPQRVYIKTTGQPGASKQGIEVVYVEAQS